MLRSKIAFCLSVILCSTTAAHATLLVNGGFETGTPVMGPRPTTFGEWRGDKVSYVDAQNGIAPLEGARMLRFIYAEYVPSSSNTSQYWQNIDLSPYSEDVAAGRVRISASAYFNRLHLDAQTDTHFAITVRTYSGTPSSRSQVGYASASILTDTDLATWELAAFDNFAVPVETTFLQLQIAAYENIYNDTSNPEFDGHYADDVSVNLTVIPEPTALAIWGALSAFGLVAVRRRPCRSKNR